LEKKIKQTIYGYKVVKDGSQVMISSVIKTIIIIDPR
jgi:hypothetical protein